MLVVGWRCFGVVLAGLLVGGVLPLPALAGAPSLNILLPTSLVGDGSTSAQLTLELGGVDAALLGLLDPVADVSVEANAGSLGPVSITKEGLRVAYTPPRVAIGGAVQLRANVRLNNRNLKARAT